VRDQDVEEHMTDFYLRNPLPRAPQSLLQDAMLPLVDSDWFKKKFIDAYRKWFREGKVDPLEDLIFQGANKWAKDEEETLEIASKLSRWRSRSICLSMMMTARSFHESSCDR
jgi:predicted molibdopterin-dependent oxidoreductase YjgC